MIIFILYSLFMFFVFISLLKQKQTPKISIILLSVFSLMLMVLISQSFQIPEGELANPQDTDSSDE